MNSSSDSRSADGGPLAGLRVVEIGRYIAAPFAGRLLADWGAEVIKVEAPDGDPMRWGPGGDRVGFSPIFASNNRGKRSITLDLKSAAGTDGFRSLLSTSDGLIHNLRPAALARLGVDMEKLTVEFPGLVAVGINGFGADGVFADVPAFDSVISAATGLYAQMGGAVDALAPTGPPWSDLVTGMFAAQALLAGLVARARHGAHSGGQSGGQVIDVSMVESVLGVVDDTFTTWFEAGAVLGPRSRQARQHVFVCSSADGLPFVVQVPSSEPMWQRFVALVDSDGIGTDERFSEYRSRIDNFEALSAAVGVATNRRSRSEWLADLGALDLCAGAVNSVAEAAVDPRVSTSFVDVPMPDGTPLRSTRPVGRFSATPVPAARQPPAAGADTIALLDELQLDGDTRRAVEASWSNRRVDR